MSEINAAYDAIKNGTADSYAGSSGGQSSSGGYGYSGGGYDDPFGFGFGFGGFPGGYGGSYGGSSQQADPLRTAATLIHSGRYREALLILNGIQNKTAKWYYYSAMANSAGQGQRCSSRAHWAAAVLVVNRPFTKVYRQRAMSSSHP